MKRKLFILSLAFALCFSVSAVQAASLSLLPASQDANPGDPVSFDLFVDFSDDGLTGMGIDVLFTPASDLSFTSWTWNPTFLALSDPGFTSEPSQTGPGMVQALGFGAFPTILDNEPGQTAGTFLFMVDVGAAPGSTIDLSMDINTALGVATVSGLDPAFNGASINVVPIPGALLLLGSGLIGLVGLRRKLS